MLSSIPNLLFAVLLIFPPCNKFLTEQILAQAITLPSHISQVTAQLDAPVEVVRWERPDIRIETRIASPNEDVYVLKYLIKSGQFNVVESMEGSELILRPKVIHTQVFSKGQLQKTSKHYRVFLPTWIEYDAS